jgi:hypothetical protein
MAGKKSKKKTTKTVVGEKSGVEVKSEPAIVDEPVFSVRTVTGVRKMTESEYNEHNKANK